MTQVTIGSKNQIVIPKAVRTKVKGMKPGQKVQVFPLSEDTVAVKLEPANWVEANYGLMSKAWASIDPIKELEKLRNEW